MIARQLAVILLSQCYIMIMSSVSNVTCSYRQSRNGSKPDTLVVLY